MKNTLEGMEEVYPMDLGRFMLYDGIYRVSMQETQKIFNEPSYKKYYIDGKGNFAVVDTRTGKTIKLKIVQFKEE